MIQRLWMYMLVVGAASLALTALLYAGQFSPDTAATRSVDRLFGDAQGPDVPGEYELRKQQEEVEQHSASCSLRRDTQNDVTFRKRFNFSIPVFQWASSFNQSDWDRLRDITPPYGWYGMPYEAVRSALALLSSVSSSTLFNRSTSPECVSCAVVGNGGILRGSKQGSAIDTHHYVFRLNGAITKGFEEDVGSKTSFYGFTTNSMKNSLRAYRKDGFTQTPQSQELKYIFIPAELRDYVMLKAAIQRTSVPSGEDKGDRPTEYFGTKPSVEKFRILHPDFITYVVKRFLKSRQLKSEFRHLYIPSTGALMLFTALHTCDQVSAYGFITRNYDDFSDHYFDSQWRPLQFFANHDLMMEARVWEILHLRGVLKLYRRR
ncbi:alpha-N-acetylgalactosaminide alpha-2,6-sialyltransferase 2-like isoform X1 [Alosa alosa]|uniref:alpha-N-acetylgalactosaminide alpha-2,6-sialyltransferase 2-like isoform X1 n=1 Tax=Alosa alosa TaxID=278164 RepID=UPI0020153197|nr:alpha-N-acetylgalactosaminide alpha-2,6-sialyltransferase 2-like isoform X1 [Alosa alosa]